MGAEQWAYVRAVRALGPAYRGDDETLLDGVAVVLEARGALVMVRTIRALTRGEGAGTRVLARLCALADEQGVTLGLEAAPLDRLDQDAAEAMTRRLQAWYKRHGFRGAAESMLRRPKTKKARAR